MYVGNQHTSTTTVTKELDFQCSHCGTTSRVAVTGVGQGRGASPYFLDEDGAADRSHNRAQKAALKNVQETLKIARCPRCGKTNSEAVRNFWLIQAAKILGGIAFLQFLGFIIYGLDNKSFVFVIFGVVSILYIPLIYFLDIHWRWKTKDGRVQYLGEATPLGNKSDDGFLKGFNY